jgi:hypothetical protein
MTMLMVMDYHNANYLASTQMSKGIVYNILRRKDEYKQDFQSNANKDIKRNLQDETGHNIDKVLFS